MRQLIICETPDDVADAAAALVFEQRRTAITERGVYCIALAGGSTPLLLYERLASEEWRDEMEWEKWEVFWGDERAVPPEHRDSNYRMAYESLLSKVPITDVWRMRGEAENLPEAAEEYARTIKSRLGLGLPVFDTVLLGMGADGHTASLFPGSPALDSKALVEVVEVSQPITKRITLTLPVLNAARHVIFLVTGSEKAVQVRNVIERDELNLPAARVTPEQGDSTWILDQAASKLIR